MEIRPINYLLILSLLFYLLSFLIHPVTAITQDLGRHLKMGEIVLTTKQIPKNNFFSYTHPNFLFVNHHWLSEIIFFLIYKIGGFNLLIALKALLITLSFALILKVSQKKANILVIAFVSLFYLPLLQERTEIRPEIFSFLLFSVYLFILNIAQKRKTRLIWFLPLLQVFWVNLHIYFFLGPVLFFFFAISQLKQSLSRLFFERFRCNTGRVEKFSGWGSRPKFISSLSRDSNNKKQSKKYYNVKAKTHDLSTFKATCFIGLLIFLVNFFNPNGLKGAFYPLNVFKNYGYQVVENKSPFFLEKMMLNPNINYFKISLGLLVLSFILNYKNIDLFSLLSASFFGLMAIIAIRNFPVFVLGTLPILAKNLTEASRKLIPYLGRISYCSSGSRSAEKAEREKSRIHSVKASRFLRRNVGVTRRIKYVIPVAFLLSALFLYQASGFISNKNWQKLNSSKSFGFGVEKGAGKAGDFVLSNKIKKPVFNNFDIGSYLIFRLYPEKVFVDGRPEAYPASFFQDVYIPMQKNKDSWKKWSQYYKINCIFFSHTDITPWAQTFLKRIVNDKNWKIVYLDDWVVILLKNEKPNKEIIEKFVLNQENISEKTFLTGRKELFYYLRIARFFETVGWQKQAEEAYEQGKISRNF